MTGENEPAFACDDVPDSDVTIATAGDQCSSTRREGDYPAFVSFEMEEVVRVVFGGLEG